MTHTRYIYIVDKIDDRDETCMTHRPSMTPLFICGKKSFFSQDFRMLATKTPG